MVNVGYIFTCGKIKIHLTLGYYFFATCQLLLYDGFRITALTVHHGRAVGRISCFEADWTLARVIVLWLCAHTLALP